MTPWRSPGSESLAAPPQTDRAMAGDRDGPCRPAAGRANGDIDRGGIMTSAVERNRIRLSRVEDRPISTVPVGQLNRSCWATGGEAAVTPWQPRRCSGADRQAAGTSPVPWSSTRPGSIDGNRSHRSPAPRLSDGIAVHSRPPIAGAGRCGSRSSDLAGRKPLPNRGGQPHRPRVPAAPVSGGDQHLLDRHSMVPQACRSGRHSTVPVSRAEVPVAVRFGSRFCDSRPGPVRRQPVGGPRGTLEAFAVPSQDSGSPAHEGFVNKCRHVRPIGTMAP
jgi:hypothetical protein